MKHKLKATILALATMAVLAAAFATVALAQSGVDEAWVNDMNQTSYWESRFGGECDKFENHSGTIGTASQVVVKDGNRVRVYDPAPTQVLGPVNPANGKHFDPPHSWVMTCKTNQVTTTSSTSSTSSTAPTTSTSTTLGSTTTSTTSPSSTSTTLVVTSSSTPTTSSTSESVPTELPRTGLDLYMVAWSALGVALTGGGLIYLARTRV